MRALKHGGVLRHHGGKLSRKILDNTWVSDGIHMLRLYQSPIK